MWLLVGLEASRKSGACVSRTQFLWGSDSKLEQHQMTAGLVNTDC